MFNCNKCNMVVTDRRSLSRHMRSHIDDPLLREQNICEIVFGKEILDNIIKQYKDGIICIYDLSKQKIDLVKLLTLLGIKRSHSEEKSTPRYIQKYKNTLMERYGVDNISLIPSCKEKKLQKLMDSGVNSWSEHFKLCEENRNIAIKLFANDPEKMLKKRQQYLQTIRHRYGVDNVAQIAEVREKISINATQRMSEKTSDELRMITLPARTQLMKGDHWETKPEKYLQMILTNLGISYTKHVFVDGFNFDLMIGDKILIEVNGDFWHANPNKYKGDDVLLVGLTAQQLWNKDLNKKQIVESHGYKVLVYWEDYLNETSITCITDRLIEELYNAEFTT